MLECKSVRKQVNQKLILKDCNFTIHRGESVGIMGESGSGKTTLAKLLVGLEKPSQGQVLLEGKQYCLKKPGPQILLIFQDALHSVNPLFTVEQILCEALPKTRMVADIHQLMLDIGLDDSYLSRYPRELSGGQLQRICIARALLLRPEIIIFDEALSGLDPRIQGQMLQLLYDLKKKYQQTYLFISHDFNLCNAICDRVLVMFEGQIVDEITDFKNLSVLTHPVTKNLLKESQVRKSKCQLRKAVVDV